MKFLISAVLVLCCIAAMVYAKPPEELLAKMQEYKGDCIKESGIDAKIVEELEKLHKGNMGEPPTPELMKQLDTKAGKCFTKCMAIKFGMVSEKGDIQYDNISKQFEVPIGSDIMKQIKQCADSNKQDDLCERIGNMKNCIMTALKDKRQ